MTKDTSDPIKKIFGKTAQEMFAKTDDSHDRAHSSNAFCGHAGNEELKHLQRMLDDLTDDEVATLTDAVGISFGKPAKDVPRDVLEGVLDEADREDFYREYYRIIDPRMNKERAKHNITLKTET